MSPSVFGTTLSRPHLQRRPGLVPVLPLCLHTGRVLGYFCRSTLTQVNFLHFLIALTSVIGSSAGAMAPRPLQLHLLHPAALLPPSPPALLLPLLPPAGRESHTAGGCCQVVAGRTCQAWSAAEALDCSAGDIHQVN